MARAEARSTVRKKALIEGLPFDKVNYQIMGVGILLIVLGYVALAQKPWDAFLPLVVSPILLVIGYCVVIPVGILYRKKTSAQSTAIGS
jgi:hypothetical protein